MNNSLLKSAPDRKISAAVPLFLLKINYFLKK